jgi:phosphoribosylformimino-5-aminoimidazole carboxamide ribotide isomerase
MAFEVIPVIDLKGGEAVRAIAGDRAAYRPLATRLCPDGEAVSCVRGYLGLHPFSRLYVADLDAIEGGGRQDGPLSKIRAAFPQLELWVDAGFTDPGSAREWLSAGLGRPVLGSESLSDVDALDQPGTLLSLDFRGDRFLGPPALLQNPRYWPDDIIVMCLHDVGTGGGPDIARLQRIIEAAGRRRVFAAGGVRGRADLDTLARLGASGALIASALHSGAIASGDLAI